jgi:hypothetical protein
MSADNSLVPLCAEDLSAVTGGTGPFAAVYANAAAWVKGSIGGTMLANKMYGDASFTEKDNGRTIMKAYLRGELDPPATR